jgi:hypothetical protein
VDKRKPLIFEKTEVNHDNIYVPDVVKVTVSPENDLIKQCCFDGEANPS